MESKRFKTLLQLKGIREKETITELEDFTRKFPYCQTSQLLYAKALHDQNSIHYDEQLKRAAAYAPDREVLRRLIAAKTEETEINFPLSKPEVIGSISAGPIPAETPSMVQKRDERFEEWYSEEEISGRAFEEQKEQQKSVDPHDIIRRRLNEILSGTGEPMSPAPSPVAKSAPAANAPVQIAEAKAVQPEKFSEPDVPVLPFKNDDAEEIVYKEDLAAEQKLEEEIVHPSQEKSPEEKTIISQAEKARDVLDKLELEHAMEESILESIAKLPAISSEKIIPPPPVRKTASETAKDSPEPGAPRSFTDWLKSVRTDAKPAFEEVHAPITQQEMPGVIMLSEGLETDDSGLSDDELIEKFLQEDPKIVPSKAEFYSPIAQAKKSVMDHDDVVSETLAKIYLQQGNVQKARWCYEKLMLLHPEKSAFFAALLKEIPEGTGQ